MSLISGRSFKAIFLLHSQLLIDIRIFMQMTYKISQLHVWILDVEMASCLALGLLNDVNSVGLDLHPQLFQKANNYIQSQDYAADGSAKFYPSLDELVDNIENVDILVLWHVLEHLRFPTEILSKILSFYPGIVDIQFQVPQYKAEYLTRDHFVFYNEPSINALASNLGFKVVNLLYDVSNAFVFAHLQKL